jgi:DMSO/TMAO reductase YedYZ heme-binding membrane subunit
MKAKVLSTMLLMAVCSPALSAVAFAGEQAGDGRSSSITFSWFSLVRPLGIATLSFVCVTFLTGLFRKKLKARVLRIHLPLAIAALILGLTHGLLVFILYR